MEAREQLIFREEEKTIHLAAKLMRHQAEAYTYAAGGDDSDICIQYFQNSISFYVFHNTIESKTKDKKRTPMKRKPLPISYTLFSVNVRPPNPS